MEKLKSIFASSLSAVVSIIVTTVVTIATEFSAPFKTWLASFTGHHWVTKSWLSVIVFVLMFVAFYLSAKNMDATKTRRALVSLEVTAILGFIILLGFFSYEYFVR